MKRQPRARDAARREPRVLAAVPGHWTSAAVAIEQDPAFAQGRVEKARHPAKARGDWIEGVFLGQVVMGKAELVPVIDDRNPATRELKGGKQLGLLAVVPQPVEQAWSIVIAEPPGGLQGLGKVRLEFADELPKPSRRKGRGERLEQKDEVEAVIPPSAVVAHSRQVPEDLSDQKPGRIGELVDHAAQIPRERERIRLVHGVQGPLKEPGEVLVRRH